MQDTMWSDLGDQTAANQRGNQLTYMIANSALTATVVFGDASNYTFLLVVSAIGVGLFGVLSFENSQQSFMGLVKSMPASVEATPMGEATKKTPFTLFRVANTALCGLIAIAQIVAIAG
ncbi:MAG: hypothetical protein ACKVIQ_01360 [Acidimicrobiales bacterium]|jgi:5-enolpyruvylshikimate-3-phosphate synthase